jgi:actin-related protein 3
LSGGSTLFKNFDKRLERQVQQRVNGRLQSYEDKSGVKPKPMGVNVTNNISQQHSVWLGGSTFATMVNIIIKQ